MAIRGKGPLGWLQQTLGVRPERGAPRAEASARTPAAPRSDGFEQLRRPPLQAPLPRDGARMVELAAAAARNLWDARTQTLEVWPEPAATAPAEATATLRLASYNYALGELRLPEAAATLAALRPDIVCLQDCREKAVRALGKRLQLHVAFTGRTRKAILARYPIELAEEVPFEESLRDRLEAARTLMSPEPLAARSILRACLKLPDRRVEVLDTHLQAHRPEATGEEIRVLLDYVEARGRSERLLLLAGDFKANAILADRLQHGWRAGTAALQTADGPLTPEAAQAELASGKVARASERYRLLLSAIGLSEARAERRLDNLLASRNAAIATRVLDPALAGTEHPPIVADIRWESSTPKGAPDEATR